MITLNKGKSNAQCRTLQKFAIVLHIKAPAFSQAAFEKTQRVWPRRISVHGRNAQKLLAVEHNITGIYKLPWNTVFFGTDPNSSEFLVKPLAKEQSLRSQTTASPAPGPRPRSLRAFEFVSAKQSLPTSSSQSLSTSSTTSPCQYISSTFTI